MIEETGFAVPGTTNPQNKLGITDPSQLRTAEADFSGYRLVELQCSPIRGCFDAAHLQNIHHYLYQDLYDWAGELRRAGGQLQQSLDRVLDRLAADNHLRGLDLLEWNDKATDYKRTRRAPALREREQDRPTRVRRRACRQKSSGIGVG
jgi:hypothetical protein